MDIIFVVTIIAIAIGFLARNIVGGKKPACHPTRTAAATMESDVVLGASLSRGLERARARRAS